MKKNLSVLVGLVLALLGFKIAIIPFNVNIGGFAGISQILNYFLGIPFSISSLLLNAPLFIWALSHHQKKDVVRAFFTTITFSLLLDSVPQISLPQFSAGVEGLLVICAAIITGLGFGLILRGDSTTGGSDYLAEMITDKQKVLSRGAVSTLINMTIVCVTACVFGVEDFVRALVATAVVNESVNITLYVRSGKALPKSLYALKYCWTWLTSHVPLKKTDATVMHVNTVSVQKNQIVTIKAGNQLIKLQVIEIVPA